MASFESAFFLEAVFLAALVLWPGSIRQAQAQPVQGFAVERFYPSAPGGGWFVMDDLNISGGLGGAVALTSGYARNPLRVTGPGGAPRLSVVSDVAFVDAGFAGTYDRYRVYFNFPMPVLLSGQG